jgi:hypothetical protein
VETVVLKKEATENVGWDDCQGRLSIMDEMICDGPIVLCSANGKYRIRLEVVDDGSLQATLLIPNKTNPGLWEAQGSGAGVARLAVTRRDSISGAINLHAA